MDSFCCQTDHKLFFPFSKHLSNEAECTAAFSVSWVFHKFPTPPQFTLFAGDYLLPSTPLTALPANVGRLFVLPRNSISGPLLRSLNPAFGSGLAFFSTRAFKLSEIRDIISPPRTLSSRPVAVDTYMQLACRCTIPVFMTSLHYGPTISFSVTNPAEVFPVLFYPSFLSRYYI